MHVCVCVSGWVGGVGLIIAKERCGHEEEMQLWLKWYRTKAATFCTNRLELQPI